MWTARIVMGNEVPVGLQGSTRPPGIAERGVGEAERQPQASQSRLAILHSPALSAEGCRRWSVPHQGALKLLQILGPLGCR